MKSTINTIGTILATAALILLPFTLAAQNEQKEKTPEDVAYEQAQKMERELKLEAHQTFYIDSVLQHDMRAMYDEMTMMQQSGTQEMYAFQQIRVKWLSQIDSAYKKILSDEQWLQYLKMTGKFKKDKNKKNRKKNR